MNIHIIQAAGPAFPTLPGKEQTAALFLSEALHITSTKDHSYREARNSIELADVVVVSHEWDPYAYIEYGIAVELQKKLIVIRDDDLIQCLLFPNYKDVPYEISTQKSVAEYLRSLTEGGN